MRPSWQHDVVAAMLMVGVSLGICSTTTVWSYEEAMSSRPSSSRAGKTVTKTKKTSKDQQARVEAKLDQVLANERLIQQKIDAVKAEVQIIKVRAASRGSIQP